MGVTLLWKYAKAVTRDGAAPVTSEGNAGDVLWRDGSNSHTVIIDAGWVRFLSEGPTRQDRKRAALPTSVGPQDISGIIRITYEHQHASLLGWLDKLVAAGADKIVFCLDGPFSVQKEEEALMRMRDRFADALNLERKLVKFGDASFIRDKLIAENGFLPRLVSSSNEQCVK
jgi:hypothetical protein